MFLELIKPTATVHTMPASDAHYKAVRDHGKPLTIELHGIDYHSGDLLQLWCGEMMLQRRIIEIIPMRKDTLAMDQFTIAVIA